MLWLDNETPGHPRPARPRAPGVHDRTGQAGPHNPRGVYTFISFATGGNCDGLGYPLWLAYPSTAAPASPPPWHRLTFWQWGLATAWTRTLSTAPPRSPRRGSPATRLRHRKLAPPKATHRRPPHRSPQVRSPGVKQPAATQSAPQAYNAPGNTSITALAKQSRPDGAGAHLAYRAQPSAGLRPGRDRLHRRRQWTLHARRDDRLGVAVRGSPRTRRYSGSISGRLGGMPSPGGDPAHAPLNPGHRVVPRPARVQAPGREPVGGLAGRGTDRAAAAAAPRTAAAARASPRSGATPTASQARRATRGGPRRLRCSRSRSSSRGSPSTRIDHRSTRRHSCRSAIARRCML